MPRLRSPNVAHRRDGDAPVQVAADGVVLGRAPDGNALEWHVGSPARGPARHHVQDCLVAGAEAPTIDDRSAARAAGGRGGGRPDRNSVPGRQQLFRSREIREDPDRWRCRGHRPRHQPGHNSGFRRYLKTVSAEHFAVDETRVAEDARFDGLYVLRTNTKLTPLQVMLRYRDLLRVEQLFRQAKAVLATRPIYHSSDMAIRGHVFCSFLALLLVKELEDRLHRHNIAAEWDDILRDLDRLQEIELEQDGKRFLLRTPTTGVAGKLFQAVGVALPPNLQELPLTTPQPAA